MDLKKVSLSTGRSFIHIVNPAEFLQLVLSSFYLQYFAVQPGASVILT